MSPGSCGQGTPERHFDAGVNGGAGGSRDERPGPGGRRTHGTAQRGVQAAFRFPVRYLRPDERQGQHFTSAVRTLLQRARRGGDARHRGGKEDLPAASPRPGAR